MSDAIVGRLLHWEMCDWNGVIQLRKDAAAHIAALEAERDIDQSAYDELLRAKEAAEADNAKLREQAGLRLRLDELQEAARDDAAALAAEGGTRVWLNGGITNPGSPESTTITIYGPLAEGHRKKLLDVAREIDRAALAETEGEWAWVKGVLTTTDDDGGRREGVRRKLHAWRANGFTIIQQDSPDGLFILRHPSGDGSAWPSLEQAKQAALAETEGRGDE